MNAARLASSGSITPASSDCSPASPSTTWSEARRCVPASVSHNQPLSNSNAASMFLPPSFGAESFQCSRPAILRCRTSHKPPARPIAICLPSRRTSRTVLPSVALSGGSADRRRNGDLTSARVSVWPMTRDRNASMYTVTSGNSGMGVLSRLLKTRFQQPAPSLLSLPRRQAALAKEPLECAPAAFVVGRDPTAAQQVTAEGVGHGQRITGRAIPGAEPALEVDAPDLIGRYDRRHAGRRRGGPPPPVAPLAKAFPLQQITDGALRRPVLFRRPCQQLGAQFLRSPARALSTQPDNRLGLRLGDCPRHHMRGARAFGKPARPLRPKPRQPLVAGLAAHSVFLAQRRHAVFFRHQRVHQSHPQFHGTDSLPRHVRTSCRGSSNLLPMLPVYSVTYVAGSYRT